MFLEVLGGVAAALALYEGVIRASRWMRWRRTLHTLEATFRNLGRTESRLRHVVADIEGQLAEGAGWAGWDVWPDPLTKPLTHLTGSIGTLDEIIAIVRSLVADEARERLRADIEQLSRCMRRAATLYLHGTLHTYRATQGRPIPGSAGGREQVRSLGNVDPREFEAVRDEAKLLYVSIWYQLGQRQTRMEGFGEWPLTTVEWEDTVGR